MNNFLKLDMRKLGSDEFSGNYREYGFGHNSTFPLSHDNYQHAIWQEACDADRSVTLSFPSAPFKKASPMMMN